MKISLGVGSATRFGLLAIGLVAIGSPACFLNNSSGGDCQAGDYYEASTNTCKYCDKGTYNPENGRCEGEATPDSGGSSGDTGGTSGDTGTTSEGGEAGLAGEGGNPEFGGASGADAGGTGGIPEPDTGGAGGAAGAANGGASGAGQGGVAGMSTGGAGQGGTAGMNMGGTAGMNAGGTAGMNAGGTPPAKPWEPCPDTGNCRILTLGDGLAQGVSFVGGTRPRMAALLAGKKFEFVGSKSEGPAAATRPHEGHPDHQTIAGGGRMGFGALLPGLITSSKPHIVVLNIGSEDVWNNFMLSTFEARIGKIIDDITAAAPDALLVVSTIVKMRDDAHRARITTVDNQIRTAIDARKATKHVLRAFVQNLFSRPFQPGTVDNVYTSTNRYYPSQMGYDSLAETYAGLFQRYLK